MVAGQVGDTERSLGPVRVHAVRVSPLDALRRGKGRAVAGMAAVPVAEQHNVTRLSATLRRLSGKAGGARSVSERLHVEGTLASFVHCPQPKTWPPQPAGAERRSAR